MANQITSGNKLIDLSALTTFAQKVKATYVAQEENKGLYPNEDQAKLAGIATGAEVNKIDEIDINGVALQIQEKKVNITAADVDPILGAYAKTDAVDTKLEDYTKTADLAECEELTGKFLDKETAGTTYLTQEKAGTTYATKDEVDALTEQIGSLGKVEGSTTTEGMATLKDTAKEGDIYNNTDDSNFYMFVGEGKTGADANGFINLGGEIDLSDFATTKALDDAVKGIQDGYVKKDGSKVLSENDYTSVDKAKVDSAIQQEAMESYVSSQLANYQDNDTLTSTLSNYVLKTDVLVADESELAAVYTALGAKA